jgi:hypothetical protein
LCTLADRSSEGGGGEVDVTEVAELRRKYNELVNFTVQLTAERDRVMESFKEKCAEMSHLQEVLAKQGGTSSGAASSVHRGVAGEGGALQETNSANNGSFTLWQLMLLSVVVFMIARLLG